MQKHILVAYDGSISSNHSLGYLAHLFAADAQTRFSLVSIVTAGGMAGQEWMLEVDPQRGQSPEMEKKKQRAQGQLHEAQARLTRQGIAQERIRLLVRESSGGVAKALLHEAEIGKYDSLLIGRRGHGSLGDAFFGSTSTMLIEHSSTLPLWLLDGEAASHRFLLAVQSQPASLLAADHLGFMLNSHPSAEILLYHSNSLFGGQQAADPEAFYAQWGQEWCEQYLDLENFLFYAHAQILMESGIPRQRIRQLPTQMHLEVSADLLRQAKQHRCGTIVLGRRQRRDNKGIWKGVSEKTMKHAEDIAVWMVC